MQIIDGKATSAKLREKLAKKIAENGIKAGLAVVYVGNDSASQIYVTNKIKACAETGIESFLIRLPEETTNEELLKEVETLNNRKDVHGVLVQLPLPKHLNEKAIIEAVRVEKDVDGISPYNIGKLAQGADCLASCTPYGIMQLLKEYNIPVAGKNAVVIGRSNTVGKPMAFMLLNENATVTVCHSKTKNLAEIASQADILVVAIGKSKFVGPEFVKEGAVVIDVGMNRDLGKLCGDVDFEAVKDKCSYITPVPGGVGPMTITMLLHNTVKAFEMYG